jgi:hypothetical protein
VCCTSMQLAAEGNMCIYCWWKWLSPDMFSRILSMAHVPPQSLKSKSALQRLLHHGSINCPALSACEIGFYCLMNLARNVSLLSLWLSTLAIEISHELRKTVQASCLLCVGFVLLPYLFCFLLNKLSIVFLNIQCCACLLFPFLALTFMSETSLFSVCFT